MSYKNIKLIELSDEELKVLSPLYKDSACPKKCHTTEKRIWFIPKSLLIYLDNIEYTCCVNCYYNKSKMNLLNNKYKREELQAVLTEDLSLNCDEQESFEEDLINIDCGFKFGAYQNLKNGFRKIEKTSSNNLKIYLDDNIGNISFVIYKSTAENQNAPLYAKIYKSYGVNNLDEKGIMLYTRTYPYYEEYCMTLDKLLIEKNNKTQHKKIKYNFNYVDFEEIYFEYGISEGENLNFNKYKITLIPNKTYKKSTEFYKNIYENKSLEI